VTVQYEPIPVDLSGFDPITRFNIERAWRRRQRRRRARWHGRAKRLNRRATEFDARGRVTADDLMRVVMSYGSRCAYCELALSFVSGLVPLDWRLRATFDHVKPLARGGRGDISNIVPSCGGCNNDRSKWPDAALGVPAPHRWM
jgi:5-methylcytosine-specific restriction endonuclease McrA